jgi:trk system potassium uptake protein TrkH
MQYKSILRIIGIFLILHSLALLPPIGIALYDQDGQLHDFVDTLMVTLGSGSLLWLLFRNARGELTRHDGFVIVAAFWLVLSATSAIPFILGPHLGFVDAFFEAASAFTTTGATVMTGLDALPRSVLFYRQELQWVGGMGIIVLAVAIMPLLGMGGMQLYRAETPGPFKDEKLTPRIAHTAQSFWLIYLGLTLLCIAFYMLFGMSFFESVAHSFATISTGGFSTHDASIDHYQNLPIEIVTEVFMLMGALNFSVHYLALHKRSLRAYWQNSEIRVFLSVVAITILISTLLLTYHHTYPNFLTSLRHSAFQTISVITSTGYTTKNFAEWPSMLPVLLIFISFIGGCSGSTAGGMKVIRFMLLLKQGYRTLLLLIHPSMIRPIKLFGRVVPESVTSSVWGFFAMYVAIFAIAMLLFMLTGADQVTAFSAVATTMNNLGPGLGAVTSTFTDMTDFQKGIGIICMILGRLELFTLLVLLSPSFWRR